MGPGVKLACFYGAGDHNGDIGGTEAREMRGGASFTADRFPGAAAAADLPTGGDGCTGINPAHTLPAAPRLRVVPGRRLCLESEAAIGGRW